MSLTRWLYLGRNFLLCGVLDKVVIPREELFTLAVSLTTLETDLNLFTIFTNSKPHSKMLCILIGGSGGLVSRNKKKIGGFRWISFAK